METHIYNPSAGEVETEGSWSLLQDGRVNRLAPATVRDPVLKPKWRVIETDTQHPPLASTEACTSTYSYTHTYTHKKNKKQIEKNLNTKQY